MPRLRIPHLDKAAHFGIFYVESILLGLAFGIRKFNVTFILGATVFASVYGGLIEYLQSNYYNRTGDVFDLLADVFGGFSGALFLPILQRFFCRKM